MATKQTTQTKQSQASKRLLKKISALRATLPADERKVLDSLIVTEVQGHILKSKNTPGKNTPGKNMPGRAQPGKLAESKHDTKEVEAHLLKGRAIPG
jgi:hypothetical protein